MTLDLAHFDIRQTGEEGVWMTLLHPQTGAETDAKFLVASNQSRPVRKKRADQERARMKRRLHTMEDTHNELVELVATAILDWENVIYRGEPLDCTEENKKMILRGNLKILQQVSEFMADDESFFPKASTS